MNYFKPMVPTLVTDIPQGEDWLYEIKYDGFRAIIYVDKTATKIISRNLNELNFQFPEIVNYFNEIFKQSNNWPLIFDGELCVLETNLKANFDQIQKRGRLKNKDKIEQAKNSLPVTFLAFDLLMVKGKKLFDLPLAERKKRLKDVAEKYYKQNCDYFKLVDTYNNSSLLWDLIKKQKGEGLIAKQKTSRWEEGKRTTQWLKIKNMMIATFFILAYDEKNSYFHIGCLFNSEVKLIGKVGQGFSKEEKEALVATIKKNSNKRDGTLIYVAPSICIEVEFLELSKNELRHPKFRRFRFDKQWEDCKWEEIQKVVLT